jgi:hypothetical protein
MDYMELTSSLLFRLRLKITLGFGTEEYPAVIVGQLCEVRRGFI